MSQVPPVPEVTVKVFISYAHADQELHRKLEEHLSSLKYSGKITVWQDQEIPAGANWEDQINTHLNEADLILLLVSSSFIASKYCWNKEVQAALERHKAGTVRVIPVILRPVSWQDTPLEQLQALPTEARPVTQWTDQDAAFEDIVRGIRKVVDSLLPRLREDARRKKLYGQSIQRQLVEAARRRKELEAAPRRQRIGFIVATNSDPGIKRKYKPNEDSLLAAQGVLSSTPIPQQFGLFVVADGMGRNTSGQVASRLTIQMLLETVLPRLVNDVTGSIDYAGVLVDGIHNANRAIHQQNIEKRSDMRATITSALIVGSIAYVANVGDCRTYLYRESTGLQKITNDHSVVATLVEAGIIKPDDIYTHPRRNQIYRSLGEKAAVEIDAFTVHLLQSDKLVLCSDGLWHMVRDPQIEAVIKYPLPSLSTTADTLIQGALEGGGEDNVSVIVVQITEGKDPEGLPRLQIIARPEGVQMPQL